MNNDFEKLVASELVGIQPMTQPTAIYNVKTQDEFLSKLRKTCVITEEKQWRMDFKN